MQRLKVFAVAKPMVLQTSKLKLAKTECFCAFERFAFDAPNASHLSAPKIL